jgi:hypothetical protein
MDSNTVTLIIGLAGIIGTVIASSLGLYFTAKSRSAPLRELLYAKQIELITQMIHKQARFRVYATILSSGDPGFKDIARDDIGDCFKEYSETTEKAAALLPTELWVEIKRLETLMSELIDNYDKSAIINEESLLKLAGMDAKVALVSRVVLGVDELTEESLKLFSSTKGFERVAKIEPEYFEHLAKKKGQ